MSPQPHPHVSIPSGAAPPSHPSPRHVDDWNSFTAPPSDPLNLWSDDYRHSTFSPASPSTSRPRIIFPEPEIPRPASRASSVHETSPGSYAFPEPHLYMSPVARTVSLRPSASYQNLGHRSAKSESMLSTRNIINRGESRPPSFVSTESSPEVWNIFLTISRASLPSFVFSSSSVYACRAFG